MPRNDKLVLAREAESFDVPIETRPWILLVVDDEQEIHTVTKLALDGFSYMNRPLQILSAYSAAEAQKMLRTHADIAVVLLDVVMESDTAGLDCVKFIREDLGNRFIRVILRTGQPGQAPEFKVITEYDINDYKEKTELTRQKLYTCVYTSLCSYRDLVALEKSRRGLLKVIHASSDLFQRESLDDFSRGVIEQLSALLYLEGDMLVVQTSGLAVEKNSSHLDILAATGLFSDIRDEAGLVSQQPQVKERIDRALAAGDAYFGTDYFIAVYRIKHGGCNIIYISGNMPLNNPDLSLLELFGKNVAIAHENLARYVKLDRVK